MTQEAVAAPERDGRRNTLPDRSYRPEVQGLRALAILMVVSYHIWFGRVSGGVDIFLLISALLLTLSFVRKVETGRPLKLGGYWLHLFKRLLPAVVVVLLGVLTATAMFVPRSRWTEILSQTWSSLFYFQNWALAANSVDYYAADQSVASPLQHFWSLSVQGQVFILWPLLFALAAFIARAAKLRFRIVVLLVFGAVFTASLTFSIYETYTNQVHAYFDTRTRLWEFAFGTLLALSLPYLKLPQPLRVLAGWIGLAAMLSGGFILDVQGQFPGYVALWPLIAAALVIVAGETGSPVGADRFLTWKPLIRLGDMSYALYLWHWPVLIIYLIWRGREEAGPVEGAAIIALSLVLAYLTTRFIERPLRSPAWTGKKGRAVIVIAVCVGLAAAPVAGWQAGLRLENERVQSAADVNNPGAAALESDFVYEAAEEAELLPLLDLAGSDYADLSAPCTGRFATDAPALQGYACTEYVSATDPDKVLVAVGNSHVQQWLAAIGPIAEAKNWTLIGLARGGCQFVDYSEGISQECNDRNSQALDYILDLHPDAVITTATYSIGEYPHELLPGGFLATANAVMDQGIRFIGIRDNPRHTVNMATCPEDYGVDSATCNPDYESVRAAESPLLEMGAMLPAMRLLDVDDLVCPGGTCPAVIGNVRVYLDENHISATYARSMAPALMPRLLDALNPADSRSLVQLAH
ncbi:acyltransferase family protein [Arthrobacter caoxuetaonis]|uniref:Acyltransferase n=1 Tax=Arthrobacter caoxuetaonis TaxID=2886935 RepID=A0A9X1MCL3_9MICC|nr:acyltransferase family protein [Arthrobacter caoxuetaonis]MCC3296775.1 acyltransferase [Arthrobacter caoxuetaonis]USQ56407.1 acyltransferase [Arthrobacter caoxuetaonis]